MFFKFFKILSKLRSSSYWEWLSSRLFWLKNIVFFVFKFFFSLQATSIFNTKFIWRPLCLFTQIKTFFSQYPSLDTKNSSFLFFYRPDHDSNSHQISSWLNKIMFGSNVKLHDKKKDPQRIWSITNWLKAFASWISQEQIELKMV